MNNPAPIDASLDSVLKHYVFWTDTSRRLPHRWACRTPQGYDDRHGSHHGGATTPELARVAAEGHAARVAAGEHLHVN